MSESQGATDTPLVWPCKRDLFDNMHQKFSFGNTVAQCLLEFSSGSVDLEDYGLFSSSLTKRRQFARSFIVAFSAVRRPTGGLYT